MAKSMTGMKGDVKERAEKVMGAVSAAMKQEHELRQGRISYGHGTTVVEIKEKFETYTNRGGGKLLVNISGGYRVQKVFHESKKRPELPVAEIAQRADEIIVGMQRSKEITFATESLRDATIEWLKDEGLAERGYGADALRYELTMVRGKQPEAKARINGTMAVRLLPEFLALWEKLVEDVNE